jgi:hypothetical protein
MLEFDSNGYLVPNRNIISTSDELENVFKNNKERIQIYDNYLRYIKDLKVIVTKEIKQWIDGSFVTQKVIPNDIDIVSFIDYEDYKINEKALSKFFYPNSKTSYSIDAYLIIVYPDTHKKSFYYKSDYAEWLTSFSKDLKTNMSKGFLEIII